MERNVRLVSLLGPAFVAAIAYIDPGNVAANLSAGSRYGYTLVWVLVLANLMAVIVQYRSAKLGIVTGRPLAGLVTERLGGRRSPAAIAYGSQALVMAVATDLAEVVGGALGLYLLAGIPMWLGSLIVGGVTMLLLWGLRRWGDRPFEGAIAGFGFLIVVAFTASLYWAPPDPMAALRGLAPTIPDAGAVGLAAAMLGATVMPHAIYLHSAMAARRYTTPDGPVAPMKRLLFAQKLDVGVALVGAGTANIAMLLYGAAALTHLGGDEIQAAHAELVSQFGHLAGLALSLGLLASGIGSALVGTHAGSQIAKDALPLTLSPVVRRALTLVPAVALLVFGAPATTVLVVSQIVLSFGIGFAAIPLVWLSGKRDVMGDHADGPVSRVLGWLVVSAIVALNVALLVSFL